jgi:hypothetical protein
MTMSSFRASPRHGHLEWVKRMVGYLSKFRFAELRILTNEPDFSDIEVAEYDWSKSIYWNASKAVPKDAPEPLGKPVTLPRCDPVSWYHNRPIRHCHSSFPEQVPYQLVFQEASYSQSSYIWKWVHLNKDLCWPNRGSTNYIAIPWRSNQRRELHVWRQQIDHQQLHSATLQVA